MTTRDERERHVATSTIAKALAVALDGRGPAVSSLGVHCGKMRPMDQATLIEVLKTYDAALRENGATGLFVFGSRAVGTERPDSDLDLFIDYEPETKIPNMFASCKSSSRFRRRSASR